VLRAVLTEVVPGQADVSKKHVLRLPVITR